MDRKPTATIAAASSAGNLICAAAGRISTTQGTALEIVERSRGRAGNRELIEKVVRSGHTSTLEHQFFSVVFDSVSVFAEQFVIEFRLGSYTVQSRRYVDYSKAGFYVPPLPGEAMTEEFRSHMNSLFADYAHLLELGIPKEDARFVLPYCFRSNFLCTMNARELLYMAQVMTLGRGKYYPELKELGGQILAQLQEYFPNVAEILSHRFPSGGERFAPPEEPPVICKPHAETAHTYLNALSPENPLPLLENAQEANFMAADPETPLSPAALVRSERPRELELIHAQFEIRGLTLAAVTHLVRHRVQTVLVPHVAQAVEMNAYVLPESVAKNRMALSVYENAFRRNASEVRRLLADGLPTEAIHYFALAGNQLDVQCAMNGRELLHFIKLRTCSRAQWEIRACAVSLLVQLRRRSPEVFGAYGPSCYVNGSCPEGRLSCGRQQEICAEFSAEAL